MKLLVRCSCGDDLGVVETHEGYADIPFEVAEQTGNHIRKGHNQNTLEI